MLKSSLEILQIGVVYFCIAGSNSYVCTALILIASSVKINILKGFI